MIVELNSKAHRDEGWLPGGEGYVINDSTSNFILGTGQKRVLDKPPYISVQCNRDSIEFETAVQEPDLSCPCSGLCYSNVNKGYIKYYINSDFINPFQQVFPATREDNTITLKHIDADGVYEYTRKPLVPISYEPLVLTNLNQWFIDTQNQRADIQALKMRTMIRHNYTPAKLF